MLCTQSRGGLQVGACFNARPCAQTRGSRKRSGKAGPRTETEQPSTSLRSVTTRIAAATDVVSPQKRPLIAETAAAPGGVGWASESERERSGRGEHQANMRRTLSLSAADSGLLPGKCLGAGGGGGSTAAGTVAAGVTSLRAAPRRRAAPTVGAPLAGCLLTPQRKSSRSALRLPPPK